ncbi:nicotinate-nucleotide adenylyltransferase [Meinhardsimonia xiamenensis]|uniref:Probable nicotinate-nucleotide adenylyltransferase n=1 Tax=Meinhardsimonia xiamenensis TaxID=990712 RepID=A0A1G8ZAX0_9RHOB|nr:nicotinate-nucleotide adenylyltransferase [Meinhardsimonia xiamenensis]SDK12211.1 nicotinate-nucleotide adenylyltransferase [Meinhardsimonia xiamenensis]
MKGCSRSFGTARLAEAGAWTFPPVRPGRRVGLLGGSFDPPHQGHVHITREALKRFGLDEVWWLVSPGNPLKPEAPATLERRMAAARAIMRHPRVRITDIEARLGTRYTAETLHKLLPHYRGMRFVWLMGADNLAGFHRWERWEEIMCMLPVGVIARPGERIAARRSPAALRFRRYRLPAARARLLADCPPPAWCFINIPMTDLSSTAIRMRGEWIR